MASLPFAVISVAVAGGGTGIRTDISQHAAHSEDGTSGRANAGVSLRADVPGAVLLFCAVGNHGADGLQGLHHPDYCNFGFLIVARWLAVRATRWSIRDLNAADTELLWLMFPRGLITAVLALQVLAAKGQTFFFMPAMGIHGGSIHKPLCGCSGSAVEVNSGRNGCPGRRGASPACGGPFAGESGFRTRNDQLSRLPVGKTSRFYVCLDHLGSPQIVQVKHSKKPA